MYINAGIHTGRKKIIIFFFRNSCIVNITPLNEIKLGSLASILINITRRTQKWHDTRTNTTTNTYSICSIMFAIFVFAVHLHCTTFIALFVPFRIKYPAQSSWARCAHEHVYRHKHISRILQCWMSLLMWTCKQRIAHIEFYKVHRLAVNLDDVDDDNNYYYENSARERERQSKMWRRSRKPTDNITKRYKCSGQQQKWNK